MNAEGMDAIDDSLPEEIMQMSTDDIVRRTKLIENEIRVLKDESTRLNLEHNGLKEKVRARAGGCRDFRATASCMPPRPLTGTVDA